MRDRLIELLNFVQCKAECCGALDGGRCGALDKLDRCQIEAIADHLLANGVIVPPCKVGQPVWDLRKRSHRDAEIREGKVSMLQQKADKSWKFRISVNSSVYDISTNEIGKTVFLTREEAEGALKGETHG